MTEEADPVVEQVRQKFTEFIHEKPVTVSRLLGWSNYVFFVSTDQQKEYVFKILCSDENDPFKWQEKALQEFIYQVLPKPIYDSKEYRVELCIPNVELSNLHYIRSPENNLVMRSVAQYNSLKSVSHQKPNLFQVLERSGDQIFAKIHANLTKATPERRKVLETQLHRIEKLLEVVAADYTFPELVLSHNDLYYGNIMFDTARNRFQLIDFEYTAFNPKGMDIFQYINEWLTQYSAHGAKIHFALEHYPSEAKAREMIRFYLFFFENWRKFEGRPDNEELLAEVRASDAFQAIPETKVTDILRLFPYFGVLANIFWYFWALDIYQKDKIKLDFTQYAQVKFDMIEHFVGLLGNPRASQAFHAPQ